MLLSWGRSSSIAADADELEKRGAIPITSISDATNHCGVWIWDKETRDKQTCHFWRQFEIPKGGDVLHAQLRIAADNAYTVYLDGRELGRGSDWRTVSAYDLSWVLDPGPHFLAVDAFNDVNKAGVIVGFYAELADGRSVEIRSDTNWFVIPLTETGWLTKRKASSEWAHTVVVGLLGEGPWWQPLPTEIANIPPIFPIKVHFWQSPWFQITLSIICVLTVITSARLMTQLTVQSRAGRLLQSERARIARDIHDDLGARLTKLLVTGEEAQDNLPGESGTRAKVDQICDETRDVLNAIDEIVWVVNPQRDKLNDSIIYICKYAESFLRAASVRCRFDIQRDLPDISLDLPFRRNIFLTIKESLSNAVKHSGATEVSIQIRLDGPMLRVVVTDNGHGFDPLKINNTRHGLTNMIVRIGELGGHCLVESTPGTGCRVAFSVPLPQARSKRWVVKWWFGNLSK